MELLNLDDLVVVKRVVRFRGAEYEIVERTLGQLLEDIETAKRAETAGENGPERVILAIFDTIRKLLPSMPEDVLRSMNFDQALAVVKFLNKADSARADDSLAGDAESAEKKS